MTSKRGSSGYQSTPVTVLNRGNCCSFFKYRHTLTIRSAAISSVSSPRSYFPPISAPGATSPSAFTTGKRFSSSGAMRSAFVRSVRIRPVERSFFPDEEKPANDQYDEDQHLDERKHLQLAVYHGPWIQKDGFNVEQDENHAHQVKLDAERAARISGGRDAAFIRQVLHPVTHTLAEQIGKSEHQRRDRHRDHNLQHDREIQFWIRRG